MVEQSAVNRLVAGSNPARGAKHQIWHIVPPVGSRFGRWELAFRPLAKGLKIQYGVVNASVPLRQLFRRVLRQPEPVRKCTTLAPDSSH